MQLFGSFPAYAADTVAAGVFLADGAGIGGLGLGVDTCAAAQIDAASVGLPVWRRICWGRGCRRRVGTARIGRDVCPVEGFRIVR